jgi:hypothetical protein
VIFLEPESPSLISQSLHHSTLTTLNGDYFSISLLQPDSDGFIAIVSPKPRFFKQEMENLLTEEQYEEALDKRANEPAEVEMEEKEEEKKQ